ncbi:MAG: hypothetical protein ACI4SB_02865 [Acutalibacteraceae bacterium]
MDGKLNLDAPIRSIIIKTLSCESECLFGRSPQNDNFFSDLLCVGCDFYDTLELFANFGAVNEKNAECIIGNIPDYKTVNDCSEKIIRKMIPHWTSSHYHTASIEDVCHELEEHIKDGSDGVFVYNSNLNTRDRKVYNDTYILIISNSKDFFFDINRKKTFKIGSVNQDDYT